MSLAAIPNALQLHSLKETLAPIWAEGARRVLRRREALTILAGCVAVLLAAACLVTCLQASLRSWFAAALAGSALAAFFLFLLWLYEHARSEEMVEDWIAELPQKLGCHPTASEVLSWAETLFDLGQSGGVAAWRRAVLREPLIQCAKRLLGYGEELASVAVIRDPLAWEGHAELARVLSSSRALLEEDDPRSEQLRQRVLDELAILQSLYPQRPECWECVRECAEWLAEPEVELAALEKLSLLTQDKQCVIAYGLGLFRHGFAGRAFALFREIQEEDPETAQAILQGYQLRVNQDPTS